MAAARHPSAPARQGRVHCRPASAPTHFSARRAVEVAKQSRGLPAPGRCVDAVEAAVSLPFDEGLARERGFFIELVQSPESKALRHAFFAERAAAKIPDVPESTATRSIRKAAVLGFGTMGGGIAMSFANAGIPVTVYEKDRAALDRGLATCRANWEATAKKGRMTAEQVAQRVALLDADAGLQRRRRRRHRDRSRLRGHGREAGRVRTPRRRHEARRDPGDEYLDARRRPDRCRHLTAAGRDRHAFLQSRQRHASARGRASEKDRQGRARHGDAARQAAEEGRCGVGRLRRLHRQSHARAVHPPVAVPDRRGRFAAARSMPR